MDNINDLLRRRREFLEEIDRAIQQAYRKPVSLLFTDIVGSTRYFESRGDIAGRQMIQTHNDLLFPVIEGHGGRIIKTIGDSIMATFEEARQSLLCAVAMQKRLKQHNSQAADQERILVRMGLHYGEAVVDEKDLFGDMVNTSARVEARADAGEILISSRLREQIDASAFPLICLGEESVKGKQEKIRFYYVNWDNKDEAEVLLSWQKRTTSRPAELKNEPPGVVVTAPPDLKALVQKIGPLTGKGNPYLNRVMVPHPAMFFGRKVIIRRIMQRINAARPQSVALVGERRIGKSSLLNFLHFPGTRLEYLDDPGKYIFLFIDFQGLRTIDSEQFISVVFSQLKKETAGNMDIHLPENREGLGMLCEQLGALGYKLILLCDEFESVTKNRNLGPDFYSFLRSLANNYALAFITASGKNLKEMCAAREISDSPFFNIFTTLYVGLFGEQEARELISRPSAEYGVSLELLGDDILALAGRYPFFLQMLCASWFDYLESCGVPAGEFAGKKAPREVLGCFLEEAAPHFEYILETLPGSERDVLKAIISGASVASDIPAEALERKGYIMRQPDDSLRIFAGEFGIFAGKHL